MIALHPTYFGPVSWYGALCDGKAFVNENDCYRRQTERNRCVIATANGVQQLTVPVTLPSRRPGACSIRDVRISDHGNWRRLHWQALQSAYGMSPFFDYYADDLRPLFEHRYEWLYDLDMATTATMTRLLGISADIIQKKETRQEPLPTVSCDSLQPCEGEYYQTFQRRHGFIPNLSIVDLLCNEGPSGVMYLTRGS